VAWASSKAAESPTTQAGRNLRVLLVSSSSGSSGGGEFYLVGLAKGLQRLGVEVAALLAEHERMDGLAEMLAPHAEVHRFAYRNTYDRPLRAAGAVLDRRGIAEHAALFRRLQPDLIHLNKQNLEDGLDLVLAAQRSRLPFLATIHVTRTMQSLGARLGRLRDRVAFDALRRTECPVVAIADACAAELAADGRLVPARIHVAANGVEQPPAGEREHYRSEWNCSPADFVIGCVARVEEQKNPLFLLRILPQLPAHIRLVWVGDGRLREQFLEAARREGVSQRVHLDGWRTDARERMAGFDAFVLPSRYEGLPLALLEAMAAGLPCVAADVDGVRQAVVPGESGMVCLPDDRASWRSALETLASDEQQRRRLAAGARRRYEQHFSLDAMSEKTAAIYRTVLGAHAADPSQPSVA